MIIVLHAYVIRLALLWRIFVLVSWLMSQWIKED